MKRKITRSLNSKETIQPMFLHININKDNNLLSMILNKIMKRNNLLTLIWQVLTTIVTHKNLILGNQDHRLQIVTLPVINFSNSNCILVLIKM